MGMGMGIDFENPMAIGVGMGMTFENGYGCGYSCTRPTPIPIPPPLLSVSRALAHRCYQEIGRQPTIVTVQAKARLSDRSGVCTPINDRTSHMNSSFRVPLSDNNWQTLF